MSKPCEFLSMVKNPIELSKEVVSVHRNKKQCFTKFITYNVPCSKRQAYIKPSIAHISSGGRTIQCKKREKMHFSQMLLKLVSNQSKTLIVEEGRFLSIETKYSPFTKFITYNVPGSRCGRPSTSAQDGSAIQCKKRGKRCILLANPKVMNTK